MLLKLRPLERGTIMPFSGELVHAAWLAWIRKAAPDVADMLHDGNKHRLFTCSSLQFPISPAGLLQAERDNVHLPLHPEKTYTVRITLLLSELFPLATTQATIIPTRRSIRQASASNCLV